MKVQIRQNVEGRWFFSVVSDVGFANGRTTYDSAAAAVDAARLLHPDKDIEVVPTGPTVVHTIHPLFDRSGE